jgi:PAS domain S-box-containing protein
MGINRLTDGPADSGGRIGLARGLSRRLIPVVLGICLLISVAFPAAYLLLQMRSTQRIARVAAAQVAETIRDLALPDPALWTFQVQRFGGLLRDFQKLPDVLAIRVFDATGRPIAAYSYTTPGTPAWWGRLIPRDQAPIVFNNRTLGTVEVAVSPEWALVTTGMVWAVLLCVGIGLALLAHRFPVRVVAGLERTLQEQMAALTRASAESERLRQRAVHRGEQLEALLDATGSVMSGLDLPTILDRIVTQAQQISGVPHVKVVLVDRAANALRVGATHGSAQTRGELMPLDRGVSAIVVQTGRLLFSPHHQDDPRNLYRDRDAQMGIVTYLGLPISRGDEVFGVLTFNTTAPKVYSPAELAYLAAFADQAAAAIENARLYEAAQRELRERTHAEGVLRVRSQQLEALEAVSAEITRELDLTRLLTLIHRRAADLLGAKAGFVSLYDEATQTLTPRAWTGHGAWVGQLRFRLGEGISGIVGAQRKGMVVNEYRSSPYTVPLIIAQTTVTAVIAEPLLYRDRLVGVITLDNQGTADRAFTEADRELFGLFAVHAAIAIENARLYEAAQDELRQRQAAEESLRKVARVVEQSPNPVIITDAAGAIEYVNPKFTEVTGYLAAEVIGQNPRLLKSGRTPAATYETLWATIRAGNQWHGEFENRKKNGDLYWEAASISPIRAADGGITHFVAAKEDITERKATEAALQDARELIQQVISSAQEGLFVLDRALRYQVWNPYMEALSGLPTAAVLGRLPEEAFPFLKEGDHPEALRRALGGEAMPVADFPFHVPTTGRTGWAAATLGPVRNAQGAVIGVIGTVRDITVQKQAETVLRESEEHARQLARENALMAEIGRVVSATLNVDSIYEEFAARVRQVLPFDRMVISVIDAGQGAFKHVHMSKEPVPDRHLGMVLPLAGSAMEEVVRTRTSLLLQAEDVGGYRERFPTLASTFEAGFRSLLHVPLFVTGELIGALMLRSRTPSAYTPEDVRLAERIGAQIAGTIASAQLYAARLAAEEERATLEEQFRQAQKMEAVGRLAGGVAHDFNNLLTVITGCAYVLLTELPSDAPLREFVGEIQGAADRAAALTRQLLAFSRKQVLAPKVLDLNDVVSHLERMLRRLIREDVVLATDLTPGLPQVRVDPGQLEQVVLNLAVNARDAMPQGGTLTIATSERFVSEAESRLRPDCRPGSYVQLMVTDTGCGMLPEVQARIFEPFFTTKELGKGTGLGLATVFGIVKQSEGHIEVDSAVGGGTSFRIFLPAVTGPAATAPADDHAPSGRETILLVEDEEAVRRIARLALEAHGYTVLEACDGRQALGIVDESAGQIRLLVSDMIMPGMNGRTLAELLRDRAPDLRVLFISGYTDGALVHHEVDDPATAFLQKPFSPQALARKVREVLDGHA